MNRKITYICSYCGAEYPKEDLANHCEEQHEKRIYVDNMLYEQIHKYPDALEVRFHDGIRRLYKFAHNLEDAEPCKEACADAKMIFEVTKGNDASLEDNGKKIHDIGTESLEDDSFHNYTGNYFIDQVFCWLGLYPEENFFLEHYYSIYKISVDLEIFRFDYFAKRWRRDDSSIILSILKRDIPIRTHESCASYKEQEAAYFEAEEKYIKTRQGGPFKNAT